MEQSAKAEGTSTRDYLVVERDELRDAELRGCEYGEVNVSLIFVDVGPGEGPRLHRHAYEEIFIVLEGQSRFTVGAQSVEDVVLPDADEEAAQRMVSEAGARLLVYGHIHTQYVRRVGDATLMSVGAINGSNDADPRPGYAIIELGETITVEMRRADWPPEGRLAAYAAAGVERRFSRDAPGPFPVRCQVGVAVTVWP
jgi:predicted phosphodiesterase